MSIIAGRVSSSLVHPAIEILDPYGRNRDDLRLVTPSVICTGSAPQGRRHEADTWTRMPHVYLL